MRSSACWVLAGSGPLLSEDIDVGMLDYDEYWNSEIGGKLAEFEKLSRDDYIAILKKYGFYPQISQKHLFEENGKTGG